MADAPTLLKRKRDGKEEQKKTPKKQRKQGAVDAANVQSKTGNAPTPVQDVKRTPDGAKSNGAPTQTPISSKKSKKSQNLPKDSANDASEVKRKDRKEAVPENALMAKGDDDTIVAQSQSNVDKKKRKSKNKASSIWTSSPAQGGWFLPIDPIFSPDEKYIILATSRSLQIYATETSTLANVLPLGKAGVITAYALSSANSNQVYVADSNGLISLWDWVKGSKIGRWDIASIVRSMVVITQPETNDDLVFCHESGKDAILNVHALRTSDHASKTELKRVLKSDAAIRGFQVLAQGRYLVVRCDDSIMVAKRLKTSKTAVQDFEYAWREMKFSGGLTTVDTHLRTADGGSGKKTLKELRDRLDIAVGNRDGAILLFEDILGSFAAMEKDSKGKERKSDDAESLRPRKLHWHRDAVGAVKWSLDGNYVISGGLETVVTIWQLATGKPQHLPHLTAAIENVVVSPSGTSYALTLANNSIVVLSTAELEAKTNIIGLQSRKTDFEKVRLDKSYLKFFKPVPMAVDPKYPEEVLLAVPSSQSRAKYEGRRPESYLQTFDLGNERAKFRQALTRNNATDFNVAPEGGKIIEPDVQFLQVSRDGQWLATIDEWAPPYLDTAFTTDGIPRAQVDDRALRREVYLKVWQRDEQASQWKLETRIDAPHFVEDFCRHGRVFDLATDPATVGFASIGEDHLVRIWRPKTRLRDGVVVRGATDTGMITWTQERAVEITKTLDVLDGTQQALPVQSARLAFSADGSILAAALSWTSQSDAGVIHLIDASTGTIRRSITEINVTTLCGLAIVGQHLIVVSDAITVWDLVSDEMAWSIPTVTHGVESSDRIHLIRLAVNEVDNTFALSLPKIDSPAVEFKPWKITSKLLIFGPESAKPLWSDSAKAVPLAIASRKDDRGYIVLDSNACIKTITPATTSLQLPTPPPEEKSALELAYEEEEDEDEDVVIDTQAFENASDIDENEKVVINQQSLQEALDPGSVLPPPRSLFSAVLALVGKPSKAQ